MGLSPEVLAALFVLGVTVYFVYALRRVENAILVLPLFFPLYLWKVELKGIPLTFMEALIYAALLAFAIVNVYDHYFVKKHGLLDKIKGAVSKIKERSFWGGLDWKIFALMGVVVLAAVSSTLISPDKIMMWDGVTPFYGKRIALGILKGWIVAPMIVFVLVYFVAKKGEDLLKMLDSYSLSSAILSVYGLLQAATGNFLTPDARASGPFESANYLALYISPALVYLAIRFNESIREKEADKGRQKDAVIFGLGFLLVLGALIFTKSYTAMVAVLVSFVVYFGIEYYPRLKLYFTDRDRRKKFWKVAAAALLFIILAAGVVYLVDPGKWQSMFNFAERNSSSVRVEVYRISCHLLLTNWFNGIGLGQFPVQYQLESINVLGRAPYELNMLHPHNFYIALWLNLGLTGFLAVMAVIFLCLKKCCSVCRDLSNLKVIDLPKLRIVGMALLLIILAHGMFDTPFFKNDLALIFWMVAAVILVPAGEKKS